MQNTERLAALSLTDEVALLRAAIRRLATAQGAGAAADLADLKRQATTLAGTLRGGPHSAVGDAIEQLVADLAEDTPPAA